MQYTDLSLSMTMWITRQWKSHLTASQTTRTRLRRTSMARTKMAIRLCMMLSAMALFSSCNLFTSVFRSPEKFSVRRVAVFNLVHVMDTSGRKSKKIKTNLRHLSFSVSPPSPSMANVSIFWHSFPYLESRGAQNIQSQTCWKVPHSCYVPQQCSSDSLHPPCFPRKLVFGLWSSYVLLFLRISHTLLL